MTDREKLIDRLLDASDKLYCFCTLCGRESVLDCVDGLADYLLSNGVTVREPGRWVLVGADKRGRGGNWKCTACNKNYPYKCDYCPNCGAPMTGGHE